MYVLIFLISIVLANLSVAYLAPIIGPKIMVLNAFLLIGLDLSLRDKLHESWHGKNLKLKMLGLVMASGLLTYLLNRGAGQIALASVVAFTASLSVDAIVYQVLYGKRKMIKMNGSNIFSAATDSIIFPTLAFGSILPWIVIGQFAAKTVGGAIWAYLLTRGKHVR